jgi:hypothetical protein
MGLITPGTDLVRMHDRLAAAHEAVVGRGEAAPEFIRDELVTSWRQSAEFGVDPDNLDPPLAGRASVAERLAHHPLAGAIERMRQLFSDAVTDPHLIMLVVDPDGTIIHRNVPADLLPIAAGIRLFEGSRWDEQSVGTNAVTMVMRTGRPQLVFGPEHYCRALHKVYCAAAPIRDRSTGSIVGLIGITGPCAELQQASTALVTAFAALGEREMEMTHERNLAELRVRTVAHLTGLSGPGMVVDDNGWVAAGVGFTAPNRIDAPVPGAMPFVPGMGVCEIERVTGGWLLRPSGPGGPVVATLDLRGEPSVTVTGTDSEWRSVLTRRHAQIVLLLADAGESGITGAELSRRLFGDTEHLVTVRAEMSRLRRVVGSLLSSRPYRLSRGVELRVVGDVEPARLTGRSSTA